MTTPPRTWRTDQRCPICKNNFKSPECKHTFTQVQMHLRKMDNVQPDKRPT